MYAHPCILFYHIYFAVCILTGDLCENGRRLSESGKSENLRDDSGDNDDGNDDNVIAMLS